MPRERFDRIRRVRDVESEYEAVRYCVELALTTVEKRSADEARAIREAAQRLEATFLIRIFAEFESTVREFWTAVRKTPTPARTRYLIDGIGARRGAAPSEIAGVHRVRDYRNYLLHDREGPADAVTIVEARQAICRFLSRLPLEW